MAAKEINLHSRKRVGVICDTTRRSRKTGAVSLSNCRDAKTGIPFKGIVAQLSKEGQKKVQQRRQKNREKAQKYLARPQVRESESVECREVITDGKGRVEGRKCEVVYTNPANPFLKNSKPVTKKVLVNRIVMSHTGVINGPKMYDATSSKTIKEKTEAKWAAAKAAAALRDQQREIEAIAAEKAEMAKKAKRRSK